MEVSVTTLITFVLYLLLMVGIGVFFFNKSNNLSDYFLGGRGLGSWVTAISAQASDMSGWLLMGLPAAAYISGLSASWIAIGLGLGHLPQLEGGGRAAAQLYRAVGRRHHHPRVPGKPLYEQVQGAAAVLRGHHLRLLPGLHRVGL